MEVEHLQEKIFHDQDKVVQREAELQFDGTRADILRGEREDVGTRLTVQRWPRYRQYRSCKCYIAL